MTAAREQADLSTEVARWRRLGLVLDLDGTLLPLAPTPLHAWMNDGDAWLLAELANIPGTHVAIVSGRRRVELDAMLGRIPGLWLLPEQGAWHRAPGGVWTAAHVRGQSPAELDARMRDLVTCDGALVERKQWSICIHYAGVPEHARLGLLDGARSVARTWIASHPEYDMVEGASRLEVRLRAVNKGAAVDWLARMWPAGTRLVVIGDDLSDEDAFSRVGPADLPIRVGDPTTATVARARFGDVASVIGFLHRLVLARRLHLETTDVHALGLPPSNVDRDRRG